MSPEDLETVRRAYDAFAAGDLEICQVVAVRDGKLIRMHDFSTCEDALEAAAQLQG